MDIIYLGHSSFHLKGKDASVVTDPFDPESVGFRFPKTAATIVTSSHDHADHNKVEEVSGVKKVISGPGEYEIEGISIIGIPSFHDGKKGEERGKNTIYVFEIEEVRICHLGDLGHKLTEETVNTISDVDVLLVPVGGHFTIDAKLAAEVTRAIDPRIIVPMHYKVPGHKEMFSDIIDEKPFINELGYQAKTEKKLSVKAGTLSEESQEIVVLEMA